MTEALSYHLKRVACVAAARSSAAERWRKFRAFDRRGANALFFYQHYLQRQSKRAADELLRATMIGKCFMDRNEELSRAVASLQREVEMLEVKLIAMQERLRHG